MHRMHIQAALLATLAIAAVPAAAQYKCTGKDGSVSFQQAPCANTHQQDAVALRDRQTAEEAEQVKASGQDWKRIGIQADQRRQARETGRVAVGMTQEDLQLAFGAPTSVNTFQYGPQMRERHSYVHNGRTVTVYLEGGAVVGWGDGGGAAGSGPRKACPTSNDVHNIEIEINKIQNRNNPRIQEDLQRQLRDARTCR